MLVLFSYAKSNGRLPDVSGQVRLTASKSSLDEITQVVSFAITLSFVTNFFEVFVGFTVRRLEHVHFTQQFTLCQLLFSYTLQNSEY